MPKVMRVVGRVVGKVTIRDIGRDVYYNDTADIQEADVIRSSDIIHAYKERWIDIIFGKELLDNHPKYSTPSSMYTSTRDGVNISGSPAPEKSVPQPQIDLTQLINGLHASIREIIKTEMANNQPVIVSQPAQSPAPMMDHEQLAASIASQLAGKMSISSTPVEKSAAIDKESQNVFINLDDDKELKGNMTEEGLGKVVESNDGKASDAIKRLSQLKKGKS